MQPTAPDAVIDCVLAEACVAQLPACDDPVLGVGERRDEPIDTKPPFTAYFAVKSGFVRHGATLAAGGA